MSDPEPSPDAPARILPIPPEARPEIAGGSPKPPTLPTQAEIPRPGPLLTTLSYVLGLLPVTWALWTARAQARIPGNDFASFMLPGFLFIGMIGACFFGMGLALMGHWRGERLALRALWLVPLIAGGAEVMGGILGIY
ncbi:hypothetical protein [Luteolibacter sp. Populi]|uniref:hypothetical protein n=1 Tax=Luteolibacter sp. Populi TaxID=3230487 RepID=UPI003467A98E